MPRTKTDSFQYQLFIFNMETGKWCKSSPYYTLEQMSKKMHISLPTLRRIRNGEKTKFERIYKIEKYDFNKHM